MPDWLRNLGGRIKSTYLSLIEGHPHISSWTHLAFGLVVGALVL